MSSDLFAPLQAGRTRLPHRIVMGSMHLGFEDDPRGAPALAAFYAERAAGGAGLIVTGGISPNAAGALTSGGARLDSADQLPQHRTVTDAVHAANPEARIVLQLLHAGRYAAHGEPVGPSAVDSPISPAPVRALTAAEVEQTIEDFGRAAALAIEAGYDGVEVMGSEGYLINQFLAPATNRRDDAWGGSAEARRRFALEVVRRVRASIGPEPLLSYRISLADLVPGAQETHDIHALARGVVEAGADLLMSGIGWHESRVPTIATCVPRGQFAPLAADLAAAIDGAVPVIASNRLHTLADAERAIAATGVEGVMLARPFLADARLVQKWRAQADAPGGPRDESAPADSPVVTPCISCNQACLDRIFTGRPAGCVVNPRAGRELQLPIMPRAAQAQRILVVGAGPAGLETACLAAEAGHEVTLVDSSAEIGGQLAWAARIPGKEDYSLLLDSWRERLARGRVNVRLGRRFTAEDIAGVGADRVALAIGVRPRDPQIPVHPDAGPDVITYADVFAGAPVGGRVAIVGGGGIGVDVAQLLAERADEVHLLQRSAHKIGSRLGATTGWIHRAALRRGGVIGHTGVTYGAVGADGFSFTDRDGAEQVLDVDTVVLCAGQEAADPVGALGEAIGAEALGAEVIGGARKAEGLDLERAIRDADAWVRTTLAA
ncbi:FAD-dependent oxidoreductase [Helcobacillus sp. ACRRO]|uniref:oxidoreductase n=1 Tax=Helcobacillus sp. ACRRO TaxID=2918202 RepID=UPI001EF3F7FC|nr:FAD-dependent oxidoreductase [Helcobacillus sp. ACRRO]MCG7427670.1 FAD-dependent oxidoreductase [Helcobacillus sp. ACRRO]